MAIKKGLSLEEAFKALNGRTAVKESLPKTRFPAFEDLKKGKVFTAYFGNHENMDVSYDSETFTLIETYYDPEEIFRIKNVKSQADFEAAIRRDIDGRITWEEKKSIKEEKSYRVTPKYLELLNSQIKQQNIDLNGSSDYEPIPEVKIEDIKKISSDIDGNIEIIYKDNSTGVYWNDWGNWEFAKTPAAIKESLRTVVQASPQDVGIFPEYFYDELSDIDFDIFKNRYGKLPKEDLMIVKVFLLDEEGNGELNIDAEQYGFQLANGDFIFRRANHNIGPAFVLCKNYKSMLRYLFKGYRTDMVDAPNMIEDSPTIKESRGTVDLTELEALSMFKKGEVLLINNNDGYTAIVPRNKLNDENAYISIDYDLGQKLIAKYDLKLLDRKGRNYNQEIYVLY